MKSRIDPIRFDRFQKEFKNYREKIPAIAGGKAVAFFKENFRRQGWLYDGKLQRWRPRSPSSARNMGRGILIDSGRMRRSIRILQKSSFAVKIGTDVPYAEAHNDGARITGQFNVQGYRRRGYKVKKHKRKIGGKVVTVPAHSVSAAQVSQHTKQMDFEIEQRQFIGESPDVIRSVERELFRELDRIVKEL